MLLTLWELGSFPLPLRYLILCPSFLAMEFLHAMFPHQLQSPSPLVVPFTMFGCILVSISLVTSVKPFLPPWIPASAFISSLSTFLGKAPPRVCMPQKSYQPFPSTPLLVHSKHSIYHFCLPPHFYHLPCSETYRNSPFSIDKIYPSATGSLGISLILQP